jgi:predicted MPP superfamily phosphohydrolase
MFVISIFAIYLLPGIYVYIRIFKLFNHKYGKIIFTIVFWLLIFLFPLTETLAHSRISGAGNSFILSGYLLLPFLLYLFLSVLGRDLLLILNRLLKIISVETLRTPRMKISTLFALLVIPAVIVVFGMIRYADIKVNRYQIEIPRRSSGLQHLRIILASDFHLRGLTADHFMPDFVKKVNSLNADILLIPGDILEGDRQDEQVEEFERQFSQIQATYGVYASLGNHEFYHGGERTDFFKNSHITVLSDTTIVINQFFALVGRNDQHFYQRKPIGDLVADLPEELPVVVLDHRPTDLHNISAAGADIVVSGHTHNGQLFPFNYIADKIYELSWGYKKIDKTHVFVTSGIQLWGPPVRTTGDSEMMVIDVVLTGRGKD